MPLLADPALDVVRSPQEVDRLFPWVRQDRLRAIPHLISPAWAVDKSRFDPEAYAEAWKKCGFDSVTLLTVHHDGHYLYPSQFTRCQPDRDYFGEQVESCRRRGIHVIPYYSLSLNSLAGSEHPEWRIRDVQDRVLVPDHRYFFHYHWMCLNSGFGSFAIQQMVEFCEKYDLDSVWLDILYLPPLPPQNRGTEGKETCFCSSCHRAYADWYQGEHLIESLGTMRHEEFRAETFRRFLIALKRSLARLKRPIALSFNGAGRKRHLYYDRVDELSDWLSSEAHHAEPRSLYSRLYSNQGHAFELMSCSELVWSHNVSKTTSLLELEAATTLLHGGTYTLGINHAPDGRIQDSNLARLPAWADACRHLAEQVKDSHPVFEVGVMLGSRISQEMLGTGWWDILSQGQILHSYGRDIQSLKAARLILMASDDVTLEQIPALEDFLRKGGQVYCDGPISPRSPIAQFLQIQVYPAEPMDCYYLLPRTAELADGLLSGEPVYFSGAQATELPADGLEVLADLIPPFARKERLTDIQIAPNFPALKSQKNWAPGLIRRKVGSGSLVAGALRLFHANGGELRNPWPKQLALNLVRSLLVGQAVKISGPHCLEVVVTRRFKDVHIWILNQLYDASRWIDGRADIYAFAPILLSIDPVRLGLGKLEEVGVEGADLVKQAQGRMEIRFTMKGVCSSFRLFSTSSIASSPTPSKTVRAKK